MSFPEVLKQPSTFVAAALVTACLLALVAAIGGFLLINQATRSAVATGSVVRVAAATTPVQTPMAGSTSGAAAHPHTAGSAG